MFAWIGKSIAYCKQIFERSLVEPDVNSRLVFLLTSVCSALAILILTIAFVCRANPSDNYPYAMGAVGGAAIGHGFSRYLTKKDGIDNSKDGQ
jgi:hypothetical protein